MPRRKWIWICHGRPLPLTHVAVVVVAVASEGAATVVDVESFVGAAMASFVVVGVDVVTDNTVDVVMENFVDVVDEEEVVVAEKGVTRPSLLPSMTRLHSHPWARERPHHPADALEIECLVSASLSPENYLSDARSALLFDSRFSSLSGLRSPRFFYKLPAVTLSPPASPDFSNVPLYQPSKYQNTMSTCHQKANCMRRTNSSLVWEDD